MAQLSGDRLCAKCAFNLNGQTIVRERHYGLLMVRCPECGTGAALQEYPLLGRWAARLGYVAAAAWLGAMMLLVVLSALAVWGEANLVMEKTTRPYSDKIQALWAAHYSEEQRKATAAGTAAAGAYWTPNVADEQEWWKKFDFERVFVELGGWRGAISWMGLWELFLGGLLMVCLGSLMAVCAPHARTGRRLLIGCAVIGLGGLFVIADWLQTDSRMVMFGYYYTGYEAQRALALYLLPPAVAACGAMYIVGLWVGRAFARTAVAILLPPRLRGSLAFLWYVDGKPMPRVGRSSH
jgi:hypothetical protein